MGASAIKLLVYYHPDSPTASEIESFTKKTADDCAKHDLVLMLEPLSYSLDESKKLSSQEKRYVVVETAKRLTPLGADILKAEFPLDVSETDQNVWADACAEISAASILPWILPSAAVDYEVFLQQVVVARNAGASGIAVGRAVWKEAVTMEHATRNTQHFPERNCRRKIIPPHILMSRACKTLHRFLHCRHAIRLA